MRVFLCAFGSFSLAIPMRSVSSLTLCASGQSQTVEYNHENHNTYVSLPRLFNLQSENIRHGIILKDGDDENEDSQITENRTILLTTEVICETEIQGEEIYPVPKVFGSMYFSTLFSGILFDSRALTNMAGSPVLLLDIEQLVQRIQ